jgi:hypothetical protein
MSSGTSVGFGAERGIDDLAVAEAAVAGGGRRGKPICGGAFGRGGAGTAGFVGPRRAVRYR